MKQLFSNDVFLINMDKLVKMGVKIALFTIPMLIYIKLTYSR